MALNNGIESFPSLTQGAGHNHPSQGDHGDFSHPSPEVDDKAAPGFRYGKAAPYGRSDRLLDQA